MTDREAWIERAARLHPARIAIERDGEALSYAELELRARAVAQRLRDAYPASARIALPAAATSDFAVLLHGCLRAGVIAVPIDARLPEAQRDARLAACDAVLEPAEVQAGASGRPVPVPLAERPLAGVGADAATPAVLLYTSGSTGPGTPVLLTRGNLLWNAIGSAVALGQPPTERWLSAMPTAHVGGLTVLTRSAIGATTAVLRERFDAEEQAALLMRGQATITSVVPTMLRRLLDAGLAHPPNLRLVLLGGAPITPDLVERAAAVRVPIAGTYGMTEACSQVFTAGAALFCTRVAMRGEIDPAAAREAADEILVHGPTVAPAAAGPDGWLATGDRGERRPDGSLAVIGRLAETIISGGENVAPTEVEACLLARPGIADAAVLGVADPEWGERVEARVVLEPGASLDEPALRQALREQLPPFAVPKAIVAVAALPRTPTGKLRRRDLR